MVVCKPGTLTSWTEEKTEEVNIYGQFGFDEVLRHKMRIDSTLAGSIGKTGQLHAEEWHSSLISCSMRNQLRMDKRLSNNMNWRESGMKQDSPLVDLGNDVLIKTPKAQEHISIFQATQH